MAPSAELRCWLGHDPARFTEFAARYRLSCGEARRRRRLPIWCATASRARFTVQERLDREVVELVERILQPHGVAVHLRAVHLCTQMRGVRDQESATSTTHWRGNYESDAALRSEFLRMAGSWTRHAAARHGALPYRRVNRAALPRHVLRKADVNRQ